ncbi:MAG: hypothetical protein IJU76_12320 [Desulfovibrionaceae bacterium]|nr:hypothetical protein [Desulfovibrionaceae bacterium]
MAGKKRVLLSLLDKNEECARLVAQELAGAGLAVQAHFWDASSDAMAFFAVARELASCQAWVVACADFSQKDVRTSVSLAALAAQAEHGNDFPIFFAASLHTVSLPTPLTTAQFVAKGLGAKVAVRVHTVTPLWPDFRLRPHALGSLGLWFELGPRDGSWQGAFFATDAVSAPSAHGVGRAGSIPEKCILEYPVRGMQLTVRGIACTGWGVQNTLTSEESYFVRVPACPEVISFGPFPRTNEAELYTLALC